MATADVARLRFVMSADAGGLKSGLKEASGSLKDMNNEMTGHAMRGGEKSAEHFFHGMAKKSRSLRHFAKDIGASGALGQFTGLAHMGAAFGPAGVAAAGVGMGVELFSKLDESREERNKKATETLRESARLGIGSADYARIETAAGGDKEFIEGMAIGMKKLAEEGPRASVALQNFGKEMENFLPKKNGQEEQNTLAGAGRDRERREQSTARNLFDDSMRWVNRLRGNFIPDLQLDDPEYAEKERKKQEEEKPLREHAGLMLKAKSETMNLRNNREKLDDRLKEISDMKAAGAINDEIAGRGASEALNDFKKAQGGPAGMAGALQQGSAGAWDVIANSTMAAQGGDKTDETNRILMQQFPQLIDAVKNTKHDWKRAEAPT